LEKNTGNTKYLYLVLKISANKLAYAEIINIKIEYFAPTIPYPTILCSTCSLEGGRGEGGRIG